MAAGNREAAAEKQKAEGKGAGKAVKQIESVYQAEELAGNAAELFGTKKECVAAALRAAGITSCTVSRARDVLEAFLKKEVR